MSPNKAVRDEQVRLRMQKEIDSREEIIINLRCGIDALDTKISKKENRMLIMERELKEARVKCSELKDLVEELQSDVEDKKQIILGLEETNRELQSFINETRSSVVKDLSSDNLDFSYTALTNTTANFTDGGENLAKCVIEVQLKEKESENHQLQEMLMAATEEKESLKVSLSSRDLNIASFQEKLDKMQQEVKEKMAAVNIQLKAAQDARNEFQQLLETEKESFTHLHEKYENDIAARNETLNSLHLEIEEKSSRIEKKVKEIADLREVHTKEIEAVTKSKKEVLEKMTKAKDAIFTKMESDFISKLHKSEKDRLNLEHLIASHEKKISCLEKSLEKDKCEKSNLKAVIDEKNRDIDSITRKKAELEEKFSATQGELKSAMEETKLIKETLNNEITMLKKINDDEVGKVLSQKFGIENQLREKCHEAKRVAEELDVVQLNLSETQKKTSLQLKELQDKLTQMADEITSKDACLKELSLEVESLEKKLHDSHRQIEASKEDFTAKIIILQKENSAMKKENEAYESRESELKEMKTLKLAEVEDAHRTQIFLLASHRDEVTLELEATKASLTSLTTTQNETLKELSSFQKEKQQYAQELEKLKNDLADKSSNLEKLTEEVVTLKDSNIDLMKEMSSMTGKYNDIQSALQEKENLLAEQEIASEKKLEEISQLKQEIADKELQIENIELQKSLLREEKESVIRSKAIVDKEFEGAVESLNTKTLEITQLKKEILKESKKSSELEKSIECLRSDLKDVNARMCNKLDEIASLQKKIQESDELVNGLHINLDELKDSNTKLELQLLIVKEEKDVTVSSLNEKLVNSMNEVSLKKTLISELETKHKIMKEAITQNARVKVDFEVLQTQHNILQERAIRLESDINAKTEEIANLNAENKSNSKKIDELSNESNQRSSDLLDKLRSQEEKNQQQMHELEVAQSKCSALENENRSAHELQESQNKELAEMKVVLGKRETTIIDMVTQIDELKVVYREQVNSLEKQLEATASNDSARVQELLKKLEGQKDLEKKMKTLEEAHAKEQIFNNTMQKENQVCATFEISKLNLHSTNLIFSDCSCKINESTRHKRGTEENLRCRASKT